MDQYSIGRKVRKKDSKEIGVIIINDSCDKRILLAFDKFGWFINKEVIHYYKEQYGHAITDKYIGKYGWLVLWRDFNDDFEFLKDLNIKCRKKIVSIY